MAVDLEDLVDYLDGRLNGVNTTGVMFPVDTTRFVLALRTAFWAAKQAGYFSSEYREAEGEIVNVDDGDDLTDDDQQVIVMYAALTAVQAKLLSLPTRTHAAAAGGFEADTERSAKVLTDILAAIRADLELVRERLVPGAGTATRVAVLDRMCMVTSQLYSGWTRD